MQKDEKAEIHESLRRIEHALRESLQEERPLLRSAKEETKARTVEALADCEKLKKVIVAA